MFYFKWLWLIIVCLLFLSAGKAIAQQNIDAASSYLEARKDAITHFSVRSEKVQQRLLRRLKRKEDKMLRFISAKDSTAYYDFISSHSLSYGSISVMSRDTALLQRIAGHKNRAAIHR